MSIYPTDLACYNSRELWAEIIELFKAFVSEAISEFKWNPELDKTENLDNLNDFIYEQLEENSIYDNFSELLFDFSEQVVDEAYDRGYDSGEEYGRDQGYEEGRESGWDDAREEYDRSNYIDELETRIEELEEKEDELESLENKIAKLEEREQELESKQVKIYTDIRAELEIKSTDDDLY